MSAPEAKPAVPNVPDWQKEIVKKYGDLLNNTGGNDPLDLLNDFQSATGGRMINTNLPRWSLAMGVYCQVHLLECLERHGLIQKRG